MMVLGSASPTGQCASYSLCKRALWLAAALLKAPFAPLLYLTLGLKENVEKDIINMLDAQRDRNICMDPSQTEPDRDQDRYIQDKLVSTWQNFALLVSPLQQVQD
jgi:hypothetical protein